MKIKWAIEKETWYPEEEASLIKALNDLGIEFKIISCDNIFCDPYRYFDRTDCVLFYCSLQLASRVRNLGWYPGVFCTLENYDCNKYYPILGDKLLNNDYYFLPYGDMLRQKTRIFSSDKEVFVRPNSGGKVFTGEVVNASNLEDKMKRFELAAPIDPGELVLISKTYKIIREWRFFVVDKKVITGCLYKSDFLSDSDTNNNDELFFRAKASAQRAALIYQPDICFTVDVCQKSSDLGVSLCDYYPPILELNAGSTSAMYDCDAKSIVENVSKQAVMKYMSMCYK